MSTLVQYTTSRTGLTGMADTALETTLLLFGIDTYRFRTRISALASLYALTPAQIESFLRSYGLFDGGWDNDNGFKTDSHVLDYYSVVNHLCALGNVEKMYIPPLLELDPGGITRNQRLFELRMMGDIGLQALGEDGDKNILDVGCGRGRVASHVSDVTGAYVSGINIDPSQINNAIQYAARIGLDDNTDFRVSNLNDTLPYPDDHFDGSYQIQAFTYCRDRTAVFKELYRVLRPGGKFSYLDWVLLDKYDESVPAHRDAVRKTMPFIGAVDTVKYTEIEKSMREAGFTVLSSRDASSGGHQGPLIQSERSHYRWVRYFARLFLPVRFTSLLDRLKTHAEAFVTADELGVATTSYHIVCQKPDPNRYEWEGGTKQYWSGGSDRDGGIEQV